MTDARQTTIAQLGAAVDAAERKDRIYSEDFRAWYALYPRKRAPGDAWRAWKATKDRPELPAMLAALAWQRACPDWTKEAGKWIPYPATYLRGRRWEDEPPAVRAGRLGYCAFHATARNNGHPNPNRATGNSTVWGCPECRHVEARRGTRKAEPEPAAAVLDDLPPWAGGAGVPTESASGTELRADFAAAFPGEAWPGGREAFRRMTERRGRIGR